MTDDEVDAQRPLGSFEELVLLALCAIGGAGTGMQVFRRLQQASDRFQPSSVYIVLGRMERKAYVSTQPIASARYRGGRASTLYLITGMGHAVLGDAERVRAALRGEKGSPL